MGRGVERELRDMSKSRVLREETKNEGECHLMDCGCKVKSGCSTARGSTAIVEDSECLLHEAAFCRTSLFEHDLMRS